MKVALLDTASGEQRVYDTDMEWFGDFIWSDGNYACDCNRHLFFARAGGDEERPDDIECGESRFVVTSITLDDGSIVYTEEVPA